MNERPQHLGLRHLALYVDDFEATKRFYIDLLGFQVEWEPDTENVYLTSGSDNLALHKSITKHKTKDTVLDHLGLTVRSIEEVDAWADYLKGRNVMLSGPPKNHRDGARSFYFYDPDGNKIQIIYYGSMSEK